MRNYKAIAIMTVTLLLVSTLLVTAIAQNENVNTYQDITSGPSQGQGQGSVLWQAIGGMTGVITTEILLVDQTNAGSPNTVLVGTDGGAMAIDLLTGEVYTRYTTLDPVLSITDIADIDGQGRADFVITTRNQQTPNVIAVSTETGTKLWDHKPMVEAYTEEDGLIDKETISWCVDSIPTGNGIDVIVSSWRMVYRLSGSDGDIKWTFEGNNDIWTVVVADDLTGDSKHDVLAGSQDGDIHLLNGRTGNPVWGRDLTDIYEKTVILDAKLGGEGGTVDIKIDLSLWSILAIEDVDGDGVFDVVVSSEDGFITLISGESGNIIWSKKIILQNQPNIDNNNGVQSGVDDLVNFFNPRIKTIDDFDGDGLEDILVMGINRDYSGTAKIISSAPSSPRIGTRQKDRDSSEKDDPKDDDDEVVELDEESILFTTTGTDAIDIPVIWSTEAIVNPNGTGNYSLLIPHKNKIKLVDTNDKTNITTYFDHPILENAWLGRFQLEFFENPNGSSSQEQLMILTIGTSGLLVVDPVTQDVLWDVNNLESVEVKDIGDITGDGTDDLMVFSYLGHESSLVRSIYAIDRVTGEELWRHSVSLTNLATKGARGINLEHDFTGDGHVDILSHRQSDVPDDLLEMGNHTYIFVINGTNGNKEWEVPITNQQFYNSSLNSSSGLYDDWNVVNRRIASMITIADQNSDSISDIIVVGETGTIYLLDGANGGQLWNRTNSDIGWLPYYPQILPVEDNLLNGLVITDFSSQIFFSNLTSEGGLSVNYTWRYPQNLSDPNNPALLSGSVRLIEDLNRDGFSDVMYFSIEEQVGGDESAQDTYACHVLSGLDGSAIGPGFSVGVGDPPLNSFAPGEDPDDWPFIHDFNNNSVNDAVIFKLAEGKRAPPQIIAIDGQTQQTIWVNDEIFDYAFSGGIPLRIIEDFDRDGTLDIAVGSGRWGTQGADIYILDGKTGELLTVIEYEKQVEKSDWNMAQPVYRISMIEGLTGDGNKEMLIQRTAMMDDEEVNVLDLVDIQTGRLIRQIPMEPSVARENGDINSDGKMDLLISQGNSIYCLDGDYSLSILSPNDENTVDDKFLLEWDLKGIECEVFVDGISYGYYNDGEAELTLSGGEHEIIVETTDEFGGVLSDTITVKVPISNVPMMINIIAVIALIIFVIVLIAIKRTRLKKREEQWREKRRKIESSKKDHGKKGKKTTSKTKKQNKMSAKTKSKPKPKKPSEVSK